MTDDNDDDAKEVMKEMEEIVEDAAILKEVREDLLEITRGQNPQGGGVIINKSSCCGAPTIHTTGGVISEICTKCRQVVTKPTY